MFEAHALISCMLGNAGERGTEIRLRYCRRNIHIVFSGILVQCASERQ